MIKKIVLLASLTLFGYAQNKDGIASTIDFVVGFYNTIKSNGDTYANGCNRKNADGKLATAYIAGTLQAWNQNLGYEVGCFNEKFFGRTRIGNEYHFYNRGLPIKAQYSTSWGSNVTLYFTNTSNNIGVIIEDAPNLLKWRINPKDGVITLEEARLLALENISSYKNNYYPEFKIENFYKEIYAIKGWDIIDFSDWIMNYRNGRSTFVDYIEKNK